MTTPQTSHPASSYRRFLIDMHIPDWDPRFLSEFSADHLAAAVASANATTVTLPANNHVGLNFWPSSVGRNHGALGDRDQLAESLRAARAHGLSTVVYYVISYVEWYWEQHPDARFVFADGRARRLRISRAGSADRFRVVCHNSSSYREFVLTQVSELAEAYDADGFNIDMTMWPGPCYCSSCRRRFRLEEGLELPEIVDWQDPVWLAFARRRASWLAEFATTIADRIRSIRPDATVVHQSGPYFSDWRLGGSDDLLAGTDWLSADTYTSREGLSFALKLSNRLSRVKPAELINTWTAPAIFEHVLPRTMDEMEAVASIAVAHDCALSVIDAVDPSGTIAEENYSWMSVIFDGIRRIEPHLGGEMLHDIEIYRSFAGAFDADETGQPVTRLGYPEERTELEARGTGHLNASISAGGALQASHIPFGVVTRAGLEDLDPSKVLVLANLLVLDDQEIDAIERFIANGGRVYASGNSPLLRDRRFGLRRVGTTHGITTYLTPTPEAKDLLKPFDIRRPFTVHGAQQRVEPIGEARVLATITLPWIEPGGERYASTLTDPPGIQTTDPALIEVPIGRGRLLYCAGILEAEMHQTQRTAFSGLILDLLGGNPQVTGTGPRCVELTAFQRDEELVIFALNRQEGVDPVPITGFEVEVRTPGPSLVRLLPDDEQLPAHTEHGRTRFTLPAFRTRLVVSVRPE